MSNVYTSGQAQFTNPIQIVELTRQLLYELLSIFNGEVALGEKFAQLIGLFVRQSGKLLGLLLFVLLVVHVLRLLNRSAQCHLFRRLLRQPRCGHIPEFRPLATHAFLDLAIEHGQKVLALVRVKGVPFVQLFQLQIELVRLELLVPAVNPLNLVQLPAPLALVFALALLRLFDQAQSDHGYRWRRGDNAKVARLLVLLLDHRHHRKEAFSGGQEEFLLQRVLDVGHSANGQHGWVYLRDALVSNKVLSRINNWPIVCTCN